MHPSNLMLAALLAVPAASANAQGFPT